MIIWHLIAAMSPVTRLRVAIPHFFCEGASDRSGGYGSGRKGNRLPRSLALARCLGSVLSLSRASTDWILNIAEHQLEPTPPSCLGELSAVHVDLHLFVCGEHWLQEVVELYRSRIHLHQVDLADPRHLPLEAVRQLMDLEDPADLSLYLEDDLVIQDHLYVDKMEWFHQRTQHRFVLMPHRREPTVANAPKHLYVDGPIKSADQAEAVWASDEAVVATGRFRSGPEIGFVKASNPHSGSFCVSAPQLAQLRQASWPPPTFVGPLETAATGAVLEHFPILKPSWSCRSFLALEHANPSFLRFLGEWPVRQS